MKLKTTLMTLAATLLGMGLAQAESVYTVPSIVKSTTPNIQIYFDATGGALQGLSADTELYAYTGVRFDYETGSFYWEHAPSWGTGTDVEKYQLKYVDVDLWMLEIPDIREYYEITDPNEVVTWLNFVFKTSSSGNYIAQSEDLFVQVFDDSLHLTLTSDYKGEILFPEESTITFKVETTSEAQIMLKVNDETIATIENATELEKTYTFSTPGTYVVTAYAEKEEESVNESQLIQYYETIEVASIGGNLEKLLEEKVGDDLSSVYLLKVTGEINGRDMNVFKNFVFLKGIDLSEVTVVASDREDQFIRGFKDLNYLKKVILSPEITTIEEEAFSYCRSLEEINLENVKKVGSYAFYDCNLKSVDLSNAENLSNGAFGDNGSLSEVIISDKLMRIEGECFRYTNLHEFELPKNTYLGYYVFENTPIHTITYYKNSNIHPQAFQDMYSLKNVYCYDPQPDYNTMYITGNTDLYVPEFSISAYENNSNYYQYSHIYPLPFDVKELEITSDYQIDTTAGLADDFNLSLTADASFINNSDEELRMNNFVQRARNNVSSTNEYDNRYKTSSYISNTKTKAQNVTIDLCLMNSYSSSNAWNFVSFPFNVEIDKIIPSEETLWTIREYDGKARADYPYDGESKWVNKTNGILEAGKGYIIHLNSNNYDEYPMVRMNYFSFPAADDEKKNNIFAYEDVKVKLKYHDSEFDHNKSWNLIGNPFDSYYNINGIKYSNVDGVSRVPVTVWRRVNGSFTYEAFSADDDFSLIPFEAFFVQAIDEDNLEMVFEADGRITRELQTRSFTRAGDPLEGTSRSIFNLHLNGANSSDRTRLVINENASTAYEITCDASKFLAPDMATAQVYMIENGEKMAINERPMGAGEYQLGVRIGEKGSYTVSLDTRNAANYEVFLVDHLTGKEVNLTEREYTFEAATGSDERFTVKVRSTESENGDTTGIEAAGVSTPIIKVNGNEVSVVAEGMIEIVSTDGKVVATGNGSMTVTLNAGLYIIHADNTTVKTVVL